MKEQTCGQSVDKTKFLAIGFLLLTSVVIALLGISFCAFSLVNGVSFLVMGSQIHGAVFGLVVAFLGVRYFLAVRKLKVEVYKSTSRFSWSNFRKNR